MPTVDGALWRERVQIGKEVTTGLGVAATRVAYVSAVSLTRPRDQREHRISRGTRDNVIARTQGPITAGGSVTVGVHPGELLEWMMAAFDGAVTPTTPSGGTASKRWKFAPGLSPASLTIERLDGANVEREVGARVNQLTVAGNVREGNAATMELFGTDVERAPDFTTMTTALTERTVLPYEGWQTNLYIDALGATPGTTQKIAMISWNVVVNNGMGRKYLAQNTLAARRTTMGNLGVNATLMLEAAEADTVAELTNADANTPRLVRLEFVGPIIETTIRESVWIDLPGYWAAPDTNQADEGTRAYGFPFNYVFDPTLGAGINVTLTNNRATAF